MMTTRRILGCIRPPPNKLGTDHYHHSYYIDPDGAHADDVRVDDGIPIDQIAQRAPSNRYENRPDAPGARILRAVPANPPAAPRPIVIPPAPFPPSVPALGRGWSVVQQHEQVIQPARQQLVLRQQAPADASALVAYDSDYYSDVEETDSNLLEWVNEAEASARDTIREGENLLMEMEIDRPSNKRSVDESRDTDLEAIRRRPPHEMVKFVSKKHEH